MAKTILITGSGGPLGVNVTRSLQLGSADFPMRLLGSECNHYHTHLSLTEKTLLIAPAKTQDTYLENLDEVIAKHEIDMILPTHPVEVRTISANRDRFTQKVRLFLPDHATILDAQNKWTTYNKLKNAGLPVPFTLFIEHQDDIHHLFEKVSTRPVWVAWRWRSGRGYWRRFVAMSTTAARHKLG